MNIYVYLGFFKVYIKMKKQLKNLMKLKSKNKQHKRPISIKNVDINKIVVSNRVSFGE